MSQGTRWRWTAAAALLVAAMVTARCWSTEDKPPTQPTPTLAATSEPTTTAEPTSKATQLLALSDIELPDGCPLFESGDFTFGSGNHFIAGVRVHMELRAATCGMDALSGAVADGDQLEIEWVTAEDPDSPTTSNLAYSEDRDRWVGATRFSGPGIWEAPSEAGFISRIVVEWDDYELGITAQTRELYGEPLHIWLQDESGNLTRQWALTNGTSRGWLRDPDRVAFIQARGETNVLALGRPNDGVAETMFEVGRSPSIAAAPDGRAVAVSWSNEEGHTEVRVVAAAGWYTTLDIGDVRGARFWWSPTSDLLLMLSDRELLALSPGGGIRARHEVQGMNSPYIEWSPDGSYALLVDWASSGGTRVDRLDAQTLELERVIDGEVVMVGPDATRISPDGVLAFTWWEFPGASAIRLAIIRPDEVRGLDLETYEVHRFEVDAGPQSSIGAFTWSPSGDRLAFTSSGIDLPGSGIDATSSLALLDVESGVVRELVGSDELFTTFAGSLAWSSDGAVILARRIKCPDCFSGGQYDVVNATSRAVIATVSRPTTFEEWARGLATNEILPAEAEPGALLAEQQQLAEELLLWSIDGSPSGSSHALTISPSEGAHVYASEGTADELGLLVELEAGTEISAMLGGEHLVVLDEGRWRRVSLRDGSSEPYLAVSASSSDAGFSASPSGQLGLAYDDSGFVVLDASVPASEALEGHREWPSNVGARRGGIAWSADESQIVVSGSRAIAVIDVRSGATAEYPMDEMGDPLNSAGIPEEPVTASWGVDGTSIVFATRSGLWQLDGQTGSASLIATTPRPGGFTAGTRLSPAPDGSAMAVGTAFGVFLPEPGGTWRQISRVGLPSSGGDLHWSDDGSAVAYSGATASGQPFGVIEAPVQGDDRVITVGGTNGTVLGWIGNGRIVFVFRAGG